MYKQPIEKMVCDSDYGDGGIYFYETYLEWTNRDNGKGFKIEYKNIVDVDVVLTHKKKVVIKTQMGNTWNLYLYKYENLLDILYKQMDLAKGKADAPQANEEVVAEAEETKESDLDKLERLAKLHESGALSDEEFQLAKDKILR